MLWNGVSSEARGVRKAASSGFKGLQIPPFLVLVRGCIAGHLGTEETSLYLSDPAIPFLKHDDHSRS